MPLFWLSLAFLGGIIFSSWVGAGSRAWLGLCLAGLAVWPLLRQMRSRSLKPLAQLGQRSTRLKFPPILLLVLFALGGLRYELSRPTLTAHDLAFYNNRGTARITGWVAEPPDPRDSMTLVRLRASEILLEGETEPHSVQGTLLAQLSPGAAWHYGDILQLTGQPVDPPENEEFSYREYLARQGVYTYLSFSSVKQSGTGISNAKMGSAFLAALYALRDRAGEIIRALYPPPEAPFLSGILLGVDSGIPLEVNRAFQATGTAHIIAISGFNMAILSGVFASLFGKFLTRWWACLAALLALVLYTLFVGASPSVLRAAIMCGLGLIAVEIGRPGGGVNALLLAAGVMSFFNPNLPWDVSFQLTLAATLGLLLYADRLETWFAALLEKRLASQLARAVARPICEFFLFTLAAQVTTLPVILYHFQRLSLIALLANPLVLPPQALLMVLGMISVALGMLFLPLGRLVALLVWPLAAYTIRMVEQLAAIPGGELALGQTGLVWVALFYAVLLGLTLGWAKLKTAAPLLRPAALLFVIFGLAAFTWRTALAGPDGRLHLLAFTSENQTAYLIRGPNGQALLVNGLPSASRLGTELGRWLPPGGHRLDGLVLSMNQAAVLQGLPGTLQQFPVQQVYWGVQPPSTRAGILLEDALAESGTPEINLTSGQVLGLGERVVLRFAACTASGCALRLEMGRFSLLLPGGLKPQALRGDALDGASLMILSPADLKAAALPDWQALGMDEIEVDQTGWVHVQTDGEQMWLDQGR